MTQPFRREQAHRHSDGFFDDRCRKRTIHVRERRAERVAVESGLRDGADDAAHQWDGYEDDDWVWDALAPWDQRATAPVYVETVAQGYRVRRVVPAHVVPGKVIV